MIRVKNLRVPYDSTLSLAEIAAEHSSNHPVPCTG